MNSTSTTITATNTSVSTTITTSPSSHSNSLKCSQNSQSSIKLKQSLESTSKLINSKLSSSQPHLPLYHDNSKLNNEQNQSQTSISIQSGAKLLLSQIKWSNKIFSLKDFLKDQNICFESFKLPIIVKIIKGNYGIIKEKSSSSLLSKNSVHNLLLYKKSKFTNVLCQSIKYKDKKSFLYGNKISIPITYGGWFEVLSEDGKSVKPFYSIKEVFNHSYSSSCMKKLINKEINNKYLIRENITGYHWSKDIDVLRLNDMKKILIKTGDNIQILGEIFVEQKKMIKCCLERNKKFRFNEELNDTIVYLNEDTKGKFSHIAKMENISGVHKLEDIVKKFRFPITVQLVYGRAPSPTLSNTNSKSNLSTKSISSSSFNNSQFSPTLRLLKLYEVDTILAYPLGKESCLIQIPSYSNILMLSSINIDELLISNSNYLRYIIKECEKLAPEYSNMINYLPQTPSGSVIDEDPEKLKNQTKKTTLIGRAVLVNHPHNSNQNQNLNNSSKNHTHNHNRFINCNHLNHSLTSTLSNEDQDTSNEDYKEIDDLYEYVRSGILPDYLRTSENKTVIDLQNNKDTNLNTSLKYNNRKSSDLFDVSKITNAKIKFASVVSDSNFNLDKSKKDINDELNSKNLSNNNNNNKNINNNQYHQIQYNIKRSSPFEIPSISIDDYSLSKDVHQAKYTKTTNSKIEKLSNPPRMNNNFKSLGDKIGSIENMENLHLHSNNQLIDLNYINFEKKFYYNSIQDLNNYFFLNDISDNVNDDLELAENLNLNDEISNDCKHKNLFNHLSYNKLNYDLSNNNSNQITLNNKLNSKSVFNSLSNQDKSSPIHKPYSNVDYYNYNDQTFLNNSSLKPSTNINNLKYNNGHNNNGNNNINNGSMNMSTISYLNPINTCLYNNGSMKYFNTSGSVNARSRKLLSNNFVSIEKLNLKSPSFLNSSKLMSHKF